MGFLCGHTFAYFVFFLSVPYISLWAAPHSRAKDVDYAICPDAFPGIKEYVIEIPGH